MVPLFEPGDTITEQPVESVQEIRIGSILVYQRDAEGPKHCHRVLTGPGDTLSIETRPQNLGSLSTPVIRINGEVLLSKPKNQQYILRDADPEYQPPLDIHIEEWKGQSWDVAYDPNAAELQGPAGDLLLAANEFYVLGDNRSVSLDSRHRGPVPFDAVLGIVP